VFKQSDKARVFGIQPGADFAESLVNGLIDRGISAGPALLLPKIRLITDLALQGRTNDVPPPVSPLRRRLELTQVVAALLEQQPDLAPRAALYDLSDSLANLMDEMQGEGVNPSALEKLDVSDQSGHWQRSLTFLNILKPFFDDAEKAPDKEARQRLIIEQLISDWEKKPPQNPIIVAGSTGSRGATRLLMNGVANLPQGALVLPGFDMDLPDEIWGALTGKSPALRQRTMSRWSKRQARASKQRPLPCVFAKPQPKEQPLH